MNYAVKAAKHDGKRYLHIVL